MYKVNHVNLTNAEHRNTARMAALLKLSDSLSEEGNYDAAERELTRYLRIFEMSGRTDDSEFVARLHELGMLCHAQNKFASAETYMLRALGKAEKLLGRKDPLVAEISNSLSDLREERDAFYGLADHQH